MPSCRCRCRCRCRWCRTGWDGLDSISGIHIHTRSHRAVESQTITRRYTTARDARRSGRRAGYEIRDDRIEEDSRHRGGGAGYILGVSLLNCVLDRIQFRRSRQRGSYDHIETYLPSAALSVVGCPGSPLPYISLSVCRVGELVSKHVRDVAGASSILYNSIIHLLDDRTSWSANNLLLPPTPA